MAKEDDFQDLSSALRSRQLENFASALQDQDPSPEELTEWAKKKT